LISGATFRCHWINFHLAHIITKFAADATLSNHAHLKVYYAAEKCLFEFKVPRLFKLKKEYPSEKWQVISIRLIPLKTPVSFRWTVPLTSEFILPDDLNGVIRYAKYIS
jgi:hypothetical protein